jgi:hypothetical protein
MQREQLIAAAKELSREVSALEFAAPVAFTYNPLDYAWEGHEAYIRKFGAGQKDVLYLGMNPGPFGMAQTGVPFGEIAAVTLWAMVGNYLYNGEVGEYSHFFNWFFVVRDPFYLMPKDIAPFVMPLLNMGLFFGVNMLIRLVCVSIRKCNQSNGRRCDGV